MLTVHGYRVPKKGNDVLGLKKQLTVRPYVNPSFMKPQYVPKYPVFHEDDEYLYVPKQFGLETWGTPETLRNVPQTDASRWTFTGALRPNQVDVVNTMLLPEPHDGIISLQTGGGKTVCALYIASQLRLPTLVIVHNTFLRDQWEERIRSFLPNARIGRVQADKCDVIGNDRVHERVRCQGL